MTSAGLEDAAIKASDAVTLSSEALGRAHSGDAEQEGDAQLERGGLASERLDRAAADEGGDAEVNERLNQAVEARRAATQTAVSRANAGRAESTDRVRAATSAVSQRVVAQETSEEQVALGQDPQSDADLAEEAAADAFAEAQAVRDGGTSTEGARLDINAPKVQTAAQLFAVSAPPPAVDPTMPEGVGTSAAMDSLMEEIMVAQRGPAGGDRIGDSDAIIRVSEGVAGALQVKVKRQGDDLTLRVRAEDLAMRNVMAESLPELKHELQKANLVDGQIEVQEDGIEDQMQSEYTWDESQFTQEDAEAEGSEEGENSRESARVAKESKTPTTRRHDGELHVVA